MDASTVPDNMARIRQKPSTSHTATNKVLNIIELRENIFLHLPAEDLLLSIPLVCRLWKKTLECSALQQALFFEPDRNVTEPLVNPLLEHILSNVHDVFEAPRAFCHRDASWKKMLVCHAPGLELRVVQAKGNFAQFWLMEGDEIDDGEWEYYDRDEEEGEDEDEESLSPKVWQDHECDYVDRERVVLRFLDFGDTRIYAGSPGWVVRHVGSRYAFNEHLGYVI